MYIFLGHHNGANTWCKNHPFLHQTWCKLWCKNLGFCTKMVQKHGAICTSFCTTFCTILGCKQSFCTIFGGSRVRGQRPLSFDPPKPPHFNPLILRGLCPLRIVWGAFWDRGCFLDRLMGRVGRHVSSEKCLIQSKGVWHTQKKIRKFNPEIGPKNSHCTSAGPFGWQTHESHDPELSLKTLTLRLLNALNSEDRGLKVRFSLAMIVFETFELILCQMRSTQGKNAPSNPYPHYLVRLATSRNLLK